MLTNTLTVTRCVVDALLQVYVLIQRNSKSTYTSFPPQEKRKSASSVNFKTIENWHFNLSHRNT
jgi:hypothetical protein